MQQGQSSEEEDDDPSIHTDDDAAWTASDACVAGTATNNQVMVLSWFERSPCLSSSPLQAEGKDVLLAASMAASLGWTQLTLKTDSLILAQAAVTLQEYPPWELKPTVADIRRLSQVFLLWQCIWSKREQNGKAHDICQKELTSGTQGWFHCLFVAPFPS